jgi:hypothetical protein
VSCQSNTRPLVVDAHVEGAGHAEVGEAEGLGKHPAVVLVAERLDARVTVASGGGRHGLIVLAIPGGVHDNRVRLNERYNLPYTPDMAAVYLDDVA